MVFTRFASRVAKASFLLVGTAPWLLSAQTAQPVPPAPAACSALAQLHLNSTVIFSAIAVPAGTAVGRSGPQPQHCLVKGEVNRHQGADGNSYGDQFELRMPLAWTGRFLFTGGGGLDGSVAPAVGAVQSEPGQTALARGYAVVDTDGGHEAKSFGDASFGGDPESRADYQYHSTKLVADVAKQIVAAYYGKPATYSYMMGCSNGGREAMVAEQRYPDEFNGIIAGDPAFDLTRAAIAESWDSQKFGAIAPKNPQGLPDLSRALSPADMELLSQAVLKACDTLDGLKDGSIDNPSACHFNPAVLTCKAGQNDACLSAAQVQAVQQVFAGPKNSAGQALYSNWPYDAGLGTPGWRSWVLGSGRIPALNILITPSFYNEVALPPGENPIPSVYAFNFNTDPQRIAQSEDKIDATSVHLDAFRHHGGKIIMYNGLSDPVFSAADLTAYYNRVARANGGMQSTRSFARLFLIPGMNHCGGGPALDNFDALAAIQAWVENGAAPQRMIATGQAFPGRSRPLCPYPQMAHYKGSGSTNDAANFVCTQ